jgi:hypothetical protein|tara:strand:- start:2795 stop:3262 length:468 start_codon:yes stop_codon:yes gene_type:complete
MATTVTPSTITVTLTETYSLNGVSYGNTTTKSVSSQGEVSQRVMSIANKGEEGSSWTNILGLSTVDGQGQIVKADYAYFRITNLDDSHNLNLRVYNGADYIYFTIKAGEFILLLDAGVDATTATGAATFADIEAIAAQSNSATDSVDVEFVAVST